MLCHSFLTLLVSVGGYSGNAQSLALVANVTHMVGYEAEQPFEHVNGSACCLDVSIEVGSLEACRSHCVKDGECGSFLFNAAERQCFLISQLSNFQPVDGPRGCERRCVEQKECEAFVFQPSNKLCFLIQFTVPEFGGAARSASIGSAQDRIFGLVRDCQSGGIQAEISRSLLGDGGHNDSVARVASEVVSGEEESPSTAMNGSSMPLGLEVASHAGSNGDGAGCWDACLGSVLAAIALVAFASFVGVMGRAMCVIPRPRLPEVPVISLSPTKPIQLARNGRSSVLEKGVKAEGAMAKSTSPTAKATTSNKETTIVAAAAVGAPLHKERPPCLRSEQTVPSSSSRTLAASTSSASTATTKILKTVVPASSDTERGRVASAVKVSTSACSEGVMRMLSQAVPPAKAFVPVRRRVDFAGPTNYPVAGETSPHARSTSLHMLREATDEEENSARVDAGIAPDNSLDEESTANVSDAVFVGIPEVVLMLGALLLSLLNFDHRTVAVIAFTATVALYLAARGVRPLTTRASACQDEIGATDHNVIPRSACLTQANLKSHNVRHSELPGSKAHVQESEAAPKYGVKSSRQTPAHFDVKTCKGGG